MGVVSQALERRRTEAIERVQVRHMAEAHPLGIVAAAAAIPLDGTGWVTFKLGDQKWQKDAWHHYDINGDLRFIANWIGKACSRARLYLAKVDENGRPGEEVDDPRLQIIAETLFGSPAAKAEAQRLLGIHLFVPGESFIVAEAADNANEDRWYVVSTSDIRRQGQKQIEVKRPQQFGGGWYALDPQTDLLIRAWTPHPRAYDLADSSVRAALIPLREIEQLTKFEFAEIDSRLAGAGILLVPQEMDFPRKPGEQANAASLAALITRTMAASLANREDPSSLVPIVIEVPGELVDKVKHLTFANLLSGELKDRMEGAVNRLARSLETEPEILTGKADMNHWSAWQVDESTINIHVAPLLSRMCDALTSGYVRAALRILGEDPDGYVLWYDTSALTVEPDRQKDGLELWEKGLLSDAATRKAGSWGEGDAPDDEEFLRRYAEALVKLDPSKIEWPDVRKAIGRGVEKWEPPAAPAEGADQPNAPAGPAGADVPGGGAPNPDNVRGLPDRRETRQAAALRVGAHMAVQRALELAGKRLLTRQNRDRYRDVAAHELHTVIRVGDPNRVETLLASADGPAVDLSVVAEASGVAEEDLAGFLTAYCSELMVRGVRHNGDLLAHFLATALHAECDEMGCWHPEHPGRCDEEVRAFHLPGRHNQKTHGHRVGKPRVAGDAPGVGPFTEAEKRKRKSMREGRWSGDGKKIDPDRNAPAPDRQGRRAFKEWTEYARYLSGQEKRTEQVETRKVALEVGKPEGANAREDAWKAVEAKLNEQYDDMARRVQRNLDEARRSKDGQDKFGNTVKDLEEMLSDFEETRRRRLIEERAKFFNQNPDVLDGADETLTPWHDRILTDTGEKPLKIKNLVVSGYKMKSGYAIRRGNLAFAIEVDNEADAQRIARELETAHRSLPEDRDLYQNRYVWAQGDSPNDAYWQKKFGNSNHQSFASAGDGGVNFWRRRVYANSVGDTEQGTLVHEYGHNRDNAGGAKRHEQSDSSAFAAARDEDGDRWYTAKGTPRASNPFRNFRAVPTSRGTFPVVLQPMGSVNGVRMAQPYGVTEYGKSSNAEDFAEALRLYHAGVVGFADMKLRGGGWTPQQVPLYFRDLFPARAAEFDRLYPDAAKMQKEALRRQRAGSAVDWPKGWA